MSSRVAWARGGSASAFGVSNKNAICSEECPQILILESSSTLIWQKCVIGASVQRRGTSSITGSQENQPCNMPPKMRPLLSHTATSDFTVSHLKRTAADYIRAAAKSMRIRSPLAWTAMSSPPFTVALTLLLARTATMDQSSGCIHLARLANGKPWTKNLSVT